VVLDWFEVDPGGPGARKRSRRERTGAERLHKILGAKAPLQALGRPRRAPRIPALADPRRERTRGDRLPDVTGEYVRFGPGPVADGWRTNTESEKGVVALPGSRPASCRQVGGPPAKGMAPVAQRLVEPVGAPTMRRAGDPAPVH